MFKIADILNNDGIEAANFKNHLNEISFKGYLSGNQSIAVITDISGVYISANKVYTELTGFTEEELRGINFFELNRINGFRNSKKATEFISKSGNEINIPVKIRSSYGEYIRCQCRFWKFNIDRTPYLLINYSSNNADDNPVRNTDNDTYISPARLLELRHRIKNHFQIIIYSISSRIGLNSANDVTYILKDTVSRITSLSLLYNYLDYCGNSRLVELSEYLETLAGLITNIYSIDERTIRLNTSMSKVTVDQKVAEHIGVIMTELLTNSMKYAFVNSTSGEICITLLHEQDKIKFSVSDNGCGINDSHATDSSSQGLYIVKMLTGHINGTININSGRGTHISIEIPF